MKTALTDELKILNDKIKPNQAQYDLGKRAVKISALSSGELEKYEHFNREDSGYKPGVVKKIKFEYYPLGQVFNKRLDEKNNKEETFKSLKILKARIKSN